MAVLKPYDEFMAVYRECVTDVFTPCDQELKRKIGSVEEELKARKAERVKAYFLEYCQSVGIDFLRFEDVGLNITKTVSEKRLKESAKACVDRVAQDCAVIGQQEHAAEIMAEYRVNGFDCVGAMNAVAIPPAERTRMQDAPGRTGRIGTAGAGTPGGNAPGGANGVCASPGV